MNVNEAKNKQAQIVKETAELMDKTLYPVNLVPANFNNWLSAALRNESQRTLECDWPTLKALMHATGNEFNLNLMGFALNAIESKTPVQLGISNEDYESLQDQVFVMCSAWNMIVTPLKEQVKRRLLSVKEIYKGNNKTIHH